MGISLPYAFMALLEQALRVGTDDAHYYEERINTGGVFVSVNTANGRFSGDTALDIMNRAGGHGSGRAKLRSTI